MIFAEGDHDEFHAKPFASPLEHALQGYGVEVRAVPKLHDAVRVDPTLHLLDHLFQVAELAGGEAEVQVEEVPGKIGSEEDRRAEYIFFKHFDHLPVGIVVSSGDAAT